MISLGIDVGTSFIKVCMYDYCQNFSKTITWPKKEMEILSAKSNWAEQDAALWWLNIKQGIKDIFVDIPYQINQVDCIGITYQMHGLVLVDKNNKPVRNAIIWCDARTENEANFIEEKLGRAFLQDNLLNHPNHFTLSKLLWVKKNEPELFLQATSFLLPGDFVAMKLTGSCSTTPSGLSESMMWDYRTNSLIGVWETLGLDKNIVPNVVPNFFDQLKIDQKIAYEFGFRADVVVSYRAGDQVNNGFFMGATEEGVAVASAGTSGVIYSLSKSAKSDVQGRFNSFLHISASNDKIVSKLLCINSMAISYRWVKDNLFAEIGSYTELNKILIDAESDDLIVLPFGNVSERILGNMDTTASILNINYNKHTRVNILKAFFEALLFSYKYSFEILEKNEVKLAQLHVSPDGLFKNDFFTQNLSNLLGIPIRVLEFDGAMGAAKGAIIGNNNALLSQMLDHNFLKEFIPRADQKLQLNYAKWNIELHQYLQKNSK